MATTLPADLYLRNFAVPYAEQKWVQNMDLLKGFAGPAGSGAPVTITASPEFLNAGHYADNPVLKLINSGTVIERRDIANGTNAVTSRKFEAQNELGVFVRFRSSIDIGEDAARIPWGVSMQMFVENWINQMAKAWPALLQTYVIAVIRACLDNMTSTAHTKSVWSATVETDLSTALLMQILQKLTDKQQEYAGAGKGVWVMKSGPALDLGLHQEGRGVTGISDVVTREGKIQTLGIPYMVAEDSSLETTDAGFDKYYTQFIGPGSMNFKFEAPRIYMPEERLDTEVVHRLLRADMDAYIQVPGFEYDDGAGGINPTLSAIGTSTNWDVLYADAREIPFAMGEHNYSGDL